jgi:hypothetical protein
MKNLGTVLFEMGWYVHGALRVREGDESCERCVVPLRLLAVKDTIQPVVVGIEIRGTFAVGLGTTRAEPPLTDASSWTVRSCHLNE